MGRTTYVVEHIVGYLERTASVGKSWREDSPSDRCPVGTPCRFAGRGIDWALDRRLERSREVEETVDRQAGNVLFGPAVSGRGLGRQPDHSHCVLAPPAACARFPPPSCVVSIPCGFL